MKKIMSLMFLGLILAIAAYALAPGQVVGNVQVFDSNNQPSYIPDLGTKVLTIFYTDPDKKDQNETFRELLKDANLDKDRYRGLGIVNMKDTWIPNAVLRGVIRDKVKKFNSVILSDPAHILKNAWGLGNCDDRDIVIIIDKRMTVRYVYNAGAMGGADQQQALELVKKLIAE